MVDTLPPGTSRVIGNYELLKKIAEGGMGSVYRGRHLDSEQIVAIKIVPPETAKNPLLLKRFEQEFKAASLIDHPNVVKALDYCGVGPTPFLVMEFVDGESLGARVERDGRVPEAEAIRLIGQVCEGLHGAHKQGLIHRDVKPDNILVTRDGQAKLTDLGLVKDVEAEMNLTKTGRGLGTPHFMAPEQFRNAKNADVRCDVYSLAATLYCLVTAQVPFARTSPLDCWLKKSKNDFPEPKSLAPGLSDRTNWAICRAMRASPGERPASCREFMEDLTGTAWSAGAPAGPDPATTAMIASGDLWYLVFRDEGGQPHTAKGTTDSIRRNIASGVLGDLAAIMVGRSKTGQFLPVRSVPEFRDLVLSAGSAAVLTPAPLGTPPERSGKFTPPAGPVSGRLPRPADADGTVYHAPLPVIPMAASPPRIGVPVDPPADEHRSRWAEVAPWLLVVAAATTAGVGLVLVLR